MTDALAREPGTRRRAVGWGLVALGLVAIVAMEANGAAWSTQRGTGARSLPHGIIVAAVVCGAVVAMSMFIVVLLGSRGAETPEQRRKRWANAIGLLVFLALIGIVGLIVHPSHAAPQTQQPSALGHGTPTPAKPSSDGSKPSDTWWPLVVVVLGTATAMATALVRRPRVRVTGRADAGDATIAVLEASLDDLRRERDPRRAVVAAYARMERGLAALGYARRPSETPSEYLQRALSRPDGDVPHAIPDVDEPLGARLPVAEALSELTALAEWARFSTRTVDETMRTRAIDALETLRRELGREPSRAGTEHLSRTV